MKKLYFLLIVVMLFCAQSSFAQWTVLTTGSSTTMYGIHASSFDSCFAVGDFGTILKTSNQGATWTSQIVGAAIGGRGVFFTNPSTGIVAGGLGTPTFLNYLYKTTNGGTSWSLVQNSYPNGFYSVEFYNSTMGYAVGGDPVPHGLIYKTTDAGSTWTSQTPAVAQWLNDIAILDLNTAVCVGYNGVIEKTTNGGTTWTSISSPTASNLFSVYFPSALTGYAVGASGMILKSTNAGNTWVQQNIGSSETFRSIYFFNDLKGYIVGTNGTILFTNNGGTTWTPQNSGTSNYLLSIHFLNQNLGYACGLNGTIVKFYSPCTDTALVTVYDTLTHLDTVYKDVYDTIVHYDTIVNTYDTVQVMVYDTTHINVFDTTDIFIEVYDTLQVYDTIHLYDTTHVAVTDTLIIDVLTGIAPPNDINTLQIYPNPASDHIYIETGNYFLLPGYSLKITNALGQTVFLNMLNQALFYVDLSTWTGPGTYYVYILDSFGSIKDIRKIILI